MMPWQINIERDDPTLWPFLPAALGERVAAPQSDHRRESPFPLAVSSWEFSIPGCGFAIANPAPRCSSI